MPKAYNSCSLRAALMGGALGLLLLAGCASSKVNWDARVGQAGYDEIVLEMGPPDKSATLSDGTIVAEWVVQRGRTYASVTPGYSMYRRPFPYSPLGGSVDVTDTPDSLVRLTFGADKKLTGWKRLYR